MNIHEFTTWEICSRMALGVWGKYGLVFQRGNWGRGWSDTEGTPQLYSIQTPSHLRSLLCWRPFSRRAADRLGVSIRSMDNGMCRCTAVPIRRGGIQYTFCRACGVVSCLLLLLLGLLLFALLFSLPTYLPASVLSVSVFIYSFAKEQSRNLLTLGFLDH